jgi:glucosamine--fructose-6-phosphate aminotransferase (isomerizing)
MYLGSDAVALAPFTNLIAYLEEGDWVVLNRKGATFYDKANGRSNGVPTRVAAGSMLVDKGNHRHFMAKEIHEQPEVVAHTLTQYLDMAAGTLRQPFEPAVEWKGLSRLSVSACGTAYYAGLTAKYWFERLARLPVEIDVASEFRYREAPMPENGLALFISQSGETADTLACLKYAKQERQTILSVVNMPTSTIARESDAVAPDARRPRDRRRLDQGLHLPIDGACMPGACRRPRARHAFGRG